jgi:hypothetical protein
MAQALQPFYIYDPNVGSELGGLKVLADDKGDNKYVLATLPMIQYWIDQGLVGMKKAGEISDAHKQLLKQITRGRSEDKEARPRRVPKYNRSIQAGTPGVASMSSSPVHASRKRQKERQKERNKNKPAKKPEPKTTPPAAA